MLKVKQLYNNEVRHRKYKFVSSDGCLIVNTLVTAFAAYAAPSRFIAATLPRIAGLLCATANFWN